MRRFPVCVFVLSIAACGAASGSRDEGPGDEDAATADVPAEPAAEPGAEPGAESDPAPDPAQDHGPDPAEDLSPDPVADEAAGEAPESHPDVPIPPCGAFRVAAVAGPIEHNPAAAALDGGGYVAAWRSTASATGPDRVLARLAGRGGLPAGPDIVVAESYGATWRPAVAGLPGGGFVAAWTEDSAGGVFRVMVRRFEATGVAAGAATAAGEGSWRPGVAAWPDGRVLVAWIAGEQEWPVARAFDAAGQPAGGPFALDDAGAGQAGQVGLAALPDGRALAVWIAARPDDVRVVRARAIDATGPVDDAFDLAGGTNDFPAAAGIPAGGAWAGWQGDGGIRLARFDAAGSPGPAQAIEAPFVGWRAGPAAGVAADGAAILAWTRSDGSGHPGLLAERVGQDGTTGGEVPVCPGNILESAIAVLPDSRFAVLWIDPPPAYAVLGVLFDAAGVAVDHW